MIRCEDILQKTRVDNYSEFLFAMCIAAECYRRGTTLDMRNVLISDPELLSDKDKDYFNFLRKIGCIFDGVNQIQRISQDSEEFKELEEPDYYFNTKYITELESKLFRNDVKGYYWSHEWGMDCYGSEYALMMRKRYMGKMLMHFLAHMMVAFYLREKERKPITIDFDAHDSKTIDNFISIYSCCQSMPWFGELVKLKFHGDPIDNDLYLLYSNSWNAGRFNRHTVTQKVKAMKKYGMQIGSVIIVYDRGRISKSNEVGKIQSAIIGIIRDFSVKKNYQLDMDLIALSKTKEEVEDDYYSIEPEYRYNFMDLLSFKVPKRRELIPLYNVGVCDYFFDETKLLGLIDKSELVEKTITLNGEVVQKEMSAVDAIYWLLCEYEVEFNHDLYRKMYNNGGALLWDICGSQPVSVEEEEE